MYELAGGGGGGRQLAGLCLPVLSCSVNSNWCSKLQVQGRRRLQVQETAGALVALTGWLTTKLGAWNGGGICLPQGRAPASYQCLLWGGGTGGEKRGE